MSVRRAILVVNRNALSGEADLSPFVSLLQDGGVKVRDRSPEDPGKINDVVRGEAEQADIVIIGGGDGTISRSIPALLDCKRPIGVLPLGTANDLARTLGIPVDSEGAARVIVEGQTAPIDVSTVNDINFINVAGIGIGVKAAEELTDRLKKKWGPIAYAISALRARDAATAFRVELRYEGRCRKMDCVQILVGNGRHYGAGMTISEDAKINSGKLEAYFLEPPRILDLPRLFLALRWGKLRRWDGAFRIETENLKIETNSSMPINTDGEILTETPAEFRIFKGALNVFVPGDGGPGI